MVGRASTLDGVAGFVMGGYTGLVVVDDGAVLRETRDCQERNASTVWLFVHKELELGS